MARVKVVLFFAVLIFLLFFPFFTKGQIPFPGNFMLAWYEPWHSDNSVQGVPTIIHKPIVPDVFRQLYPFKIFSVDQIKQGIFPLWNPYNGAGQPLFANAQHGLFNPFTVLFFLFPGAIAWALFIISQFMTLAFSMYIFTRSVKISKLAAIFSATSFMLSGFVIANSLYADYLFPLSGLALLLWSLEKKLTFVPIITALIILTGFPQLSLYIFIFTFCYAWYRKKLSKKFIVFFILGIGLTAFQLLPTLELSQKANITTYSSRFIFEGFKVPLKQLLTVIIPNYFGNPGTYNYWGSIDYIESAASIGAITVFFALLAFRKKFFLVVTLVTLLLYIDNPITRLFYSFPIPVLSTGVPTRIIVLTLFSLSVLAGYGFDAFSKKSLKYLVGFSVFLFAILIGTFFAKQFNLNCNNPSITTCRSIALRNTMLELLFFIPVYFVLKRNKIFLSVVILAVFIGGLYNAYKFLPFSESRNVMPGHTLITELPRDARVLGTGEAVISTDFATYYHFYDPQYYNPLYVKRYGELVAYGNPNNLQRSDVEITPDPRQDRLLTLTSVGYLIQKTQGKFTIQKRQSLPRAYVVGSYEIGDSNTLARLFDSNFDPFRSVILEKDPGISKNNYNFVPAKITRDRGNTLEISLNSPSDGLLVVTDNDDGNWVATIDGVKTHVYRANYTFRAVPVAKGEHKVIFTYEPQSFRWGIIISVVSLLLLLGMSGRAWNRTMNLFLIRKAFYH